MKISFPKYGTGELLIEERGARCIISSVIIGFFAGLCGSYLLQNKFWLLTIALIGIAGILLCLGGAAGIFLNYSRVDGAASAYSAPSANISQNVPRITLRPPYRSTALRSPHMSDPGSATGQRFRDGRAPSRYNVSDCSRFREPEPSGRRPAT